MTTASAWLGRDLAADPDRWTRAFTEEQLDDLLSVASETDPALLATIDVPSLAPASIVNLAASIRHELQHGLGFTLLRGVPVDALDRGTVAAAFMILGGAVGSPRSQNAAGHLLGHVRDIGADPSEATTRIYQTHERQTFHTDSCDAVGLLCLRPAKEGGLSMLASAATLLERVRTERPDLAHHLFHPVATDRRGEVPEDADPWFEIPVLNDHDDNLTVLYQRNYIDAASRFPGAPRLAPEHAQALDLFDAAANDPDVHLRMDLAAGDIQFVYNHALLHDRTAFVDHPEPERRRHLLRLWLSLPGDRPLPPVFEQRYGSIEIGNRGGVAVAGTQPHVTLEP